MHLSIYINLLDIFWKHIGDKEEFRRLAHKGVELYIAYKEAEEEEKK